MIAAVCPSGPTTPGIDVSVYQGTIDWAKVKDSGVVYAFIRVSNGTVTPDTRFAQNWTGARAAGVLRGAYQFFRNNEDPVAQADFLLDRMGPLEDDDLPPVIDVEATDGQPAAVIAENVRRWVERVETATGRKPIIYTGYYFWRDNVGSSPVGGPYPLWVPNYSKMCPDVPAPWTSWVFFQYSSTGSVPGIVGNVDMDKFNGDRDALMRFIQPDVVGTPDAGVVPPLPPDASTPVMEVDDGDVGGGCAVGGRGGGWWLIALYALTIRIAGRRSAP